MMPFQAEPPIPPSPAPPDGLLTLLLFVVPVIVSLAVLAWRRPRIVPLFVGILSGIVVGYILGFLVGGPGVANIGAALALALLLALYGGLSLIGMPRKVQSP